MFLTALDLIAENDKPDFWLVHAPLVWSDPVYGHIEVPAGFETDLASIPRTLRNLDDFDPNGVSRRPSVMHDWLYGGDRSRGKAFADAFLRSALVAEGMHPDLAFTWWLAVHNFGDAAWNGDQAKAALWARGPLTEADKQSVLQAKVAGTLVPEAS